MLLLLEVQYLFCSENCTTEGRGGEKGWSANCKKAHGSIDMKNSWAPVDSGMNKE